MNLYEIDLSIQNLVDPETGELRDYEAFEALHMEREAKIENLCLWYKDLTAEAKAIKDEIDVLSKRMNVAVKKADNIKKLLSTVLNGEKFKTAKTSVSYRKSSSVELDDSFTGWAKVNAPQLLRFSEPTPNKTAVKEYLASGEIPCARIVEKKSISIK